MLSLTGGLVGVALGVGGSCALQPHRHHADRRWCRPRSRLPSLRLPPLACSSASSRPTRQPSSTRSRRCATSERSQAAINTQTNKRRSQKAMKTKIHHCRFCPSCWPSLPRPAEQRPRRPRHSSALSTTYADALSARNQLLLGTLKLQGTANAVNAAQAKQIVPLWQALKGMTTTQTTVSAEITALQQQIERAMTPAQMQAIAGLALTNARPDRMVRRAGGRAAHAAAGRHTADHTRHGRRAQLQPEPGRSRGRRARRRASLAPRFPAAPAAAPS